MSYSLYKQATNLIKSGLEKKGGALNAFRSPEEQTTTQDSTNEFVDPAVAYFNNTMRKKDPIVNIMPNTPVTNYGTPRSGDMDWRHPLNLFQPTVDTAVLTSGANALSKDLRGMPRPAELPAPNYFEKHPIASRIATPVRLGFGVTEGLAAANDIYDALNPNLANLPDNAFLATAGRTGIGANGLLHGISSAGLLSEAVAPWITNPWIRVGMQGASRAVPIAFAANTIADGIRDTAEKINRGTERRLRWDAETRNAESPAIAVADKAIALKDQPAAREAKDEIVRARQEAAKDWNDHYAEAMKQRTFSPEEAAITGKPYVKPITGWNIINPWAWMQRHYDNIAATNEYMQNKIVGSIDPNAKDQAWRNKDVKFKDDEGLSQKINAGSIANAGVAGALKRVKDIDNIKNMNSGAYGSYVAGSKVEEKPSQEAKTYINVNPLSLKDRKIDSDSGPVGIGGF